MLPIIHKGFISETERHDCLAWALDQRLFLRKNGTGRQFLQMDRLSYVPAGYAVIGERIKAMLPGAIQEPILRDYLSIIDTGGQIHPHCDPAIPGYDHWRANVFLSLPDSGGMPVVEGQSYPVAPGDMLMFTPNQHKHWSESVGAGKRIILSYGFLKEQ